ncbi:MAG: hypothetical protein FWG45_02235 [Oscillospiraceae bacterium]|nr:hypothetical protein [Oscillospiraceae bacterium]
MIIFEDLSIQTRSDVPNEDWTCGMAKYVVDDYSPLAEKILNAEHGWKPVTEGDALVDVEILRGDAVESKGGGGDE